MKALRLMMSVLAAGALMVGCGGGGSGEDAFRPTEPRQSTLTITPVSGSLPSNRSGIAPEPNSPFTTQLNVRFTRADGSAVPDGTTVQMRIDNVAIGGLSILDDPETTDINEFTTLFGVIFTETSGGQATFFFHS
ncbi:MAG: hypothetical protein KDI37_05860, partial [Xanthomonadales bacterium]|nr:hypothetical protein [Xanthomonadales bacterium]